LYSRLDLDDLNGVNGFRSMTAYGNTKLGNVLFAKELHRRFNARGLSAVAFHLGVSRPTSRSTFRAPPGGCTTRSSTGSSIPVTREAPGWRTSSPVGRAMRGYPGSFTTPP